AQRLLQPALEDGVAVAVVNAEVAGAEPAVLREGRARLLGLVEVAARHQRAAELQLAFLVGGAQTPGVRMDDAHPEPGRRDDAGLRAELERLLPIRGTGPSAGAA